MITEQELLDAIDEFNRKPATISTMSALSSLYCVYDHLYGGTAGRNGSNDNGWKFSIKPDSEFHDAIMGKRMEDVMMVVDELVDSVQLLHGKLYDSFIAKLRAL